MVCAGLLSQERLLVDVELSALGYRELIRAHLAYQHRHGALRTVVGHAPRIAWRG
jgi:hypothetical protein